VDCPVAKGLETPCGRNRVCFGDGISLHFPAVVALFIYEHDRTYWRSR
jgi:hypothetical protein